MLVKDIKLTPIKSAGFIRKSIARVPYFSSDFVRKFRMVFMDDAQRAYKINIGKSKNFSELVDRVIVHLSSNQDFTKKYHKITERYLYVSVLVSKYDSTLVKLHTRALSVNPNEFYIVLPKDLNYYDFMHKILEAGITPSKVYTDDSLIVVMKDQEEQHFASLLADTTFIKTIVNSNDFLHIS